MGDQNISQILAALASQRPEGTPGVPQHHMQQPPMQQSPMQQPPMQQAMGQTYQGAYPTPPPPVATSNYSLPQPTSSGNLDLSGVKPSSSSSVSLAEAVARARGIAAERGTPFDPSRGPAYGSRDSRNRRRSRSRSRSPPHIKRESYRDGYNPYREERRNSGFRERSFSPGAGGRQPGTDRMGGPGADGGMESITIESHLVGLIIGRSGENLRRVESETGARVQFLTGPDASGSHRPCKISGPRAARDHAKAEIARIIQENGKTTQMNLMPSMGHANPRASGANTPIRSVGSNEESIQMMVPNRTVGLIIGRGGETIRDLQERSGCHVNILSEDKTVSGLRPVNLIGTREQGNMAKELILEIVDSDSRGQAQMGGMPAGRPVMTNTGRSDAIGERINDSIMVPSGAVGMIIGKGGETIKEMQNSTGCKINVSQPSGRDVEREIGLIGTRDSIEFAKRAIMEKVRAVEEKNSGGGGGGSRSNQYDQYGSGPQGYNQGGYNQSYSQYPQQSTPQGNPPPQAQPADPYAAYGGYENYMALWYSHVSQGQNQQQGQGQNPYSGAGNGPQPS